MEKIKVLQVIDGIGWSGTKEQVYLLTRELSKRENIEVGIALSEKYSEMIEKLSPFPVNFHFFEISFNDLKTPICNPAIKAAPNAVVSLVCDR